MRKRKIVRLALLSFAALAVLMLAAAGGDISHHHDCTSRSPCQICHLSHQLVDTPLARHAAPAPERLGSMTVAEEKDPLLCPFSPRIPTRAPPSL